MDVHIGEEIKCVFDTKRKKKLTSVKLICGELSMSKETLYRIFKSKYIDIERLWRISKILEYDFFRDLSNRYFKHKQTRANIYLQKENKRLKAELEYVKMENKLLWQANDMLSNK